MGSGLGHLHFAHLRTLFFKLFFHSGLSGLNGLSGLWITEGWLEASLRQQGTEVNRCRACGACDACDAWLLQSPERSDVLRPSDISDQFWRDQGASISDSPERHLDSCDKLCKLCYSGLFRKFWTILVMGKMMHIIDAHSNYAQKRSQKHIYVYGEGCLG